VPLSHHQMDSTHITPGVLRADIAPGGFGIDASWFRGEEPDENRTDLDLGRLDSWALRGRWARERWSAQVSGGHLHRPEWVEPYFDVVRLTASIAYTRPDASLATLLAWGQDRTVHGIEDGYLAEGSWRPTPRSTFYARAENTTRDIFGGGRHPPGFTHFHPLAKVGALTLGYVRDLWTGRAGRRLGLGADVTGYHVPPLFKPAYGQPRSFHVFARLRPATGHAHPLNDRTTTGCGYDGRRENCP
jgi:hypothetical protein